MTPSKELWKVLVAGTIVFLAIFSVLKLSSPSQAVEEVSSVSHSLVGTAEAFNGPMTVQVDMNGSDIIKISVTDHSDDIDWYLKAKTGVIPAIIETQSPDVDVVSGATFSSNGIINAVKNALESEKK